MTDNTATADGICYRCGLTIPEGEPGLVCFLGSDDGKYIRITTAHVPPCPGAEIRALFAAEGDDRHVVSRGGRR